MKEDFEQFLIAQFGEHIRSVFSDFDQEDGYADSIINAMWIGFNAGHLLAS